MSRFEFRQLALPNILKEIGRNLLTQFFARFQQDLAAKNIILPSLILGDNAYFTFLPSLLVCRSTLPASLQEALIEIEEMAGPEGQERLQHALALAGLSLSAAADSSPERLSLQIWLEAPELLWREHRKQDPHKLASFDLFESTVARAARLPFVAPDAATLRALTAPIVEWFSDNHHAIHTTRIDYHLEPEGQHWFRVQHGDTCRWTRKRGNEATEFVELTIEDEEYILYAAPDHRLWISARTTAELDLYRRVFGLVLRGHPDYFSAPRGLTLEPLREQRGDAPETNGNPAIRRMLLQGVKILRESGLHEIISIGRFKSKKH